MNPKVQRKRVSRVEGGHGGTEVGCERIHQKEDFAIRGGGKNLFNPSFKAGAKSEPGDSGCGASEGRTRAMVGQWGGGDSDGVAHTTVAMALNK